MHKPGSSVSHFVDIIMSWRCIIYTTCSHTLKNLSSYFRQPAFSYTACRQEICRHSCYFKSTNILMSVSRDSVSRHNDILFIDMTWYVEPCHCNFDDLLCCSSRRGWLNVFIPGIHTSFYGNVYGTPLWCHFMRRCVLVGLHYHTKLS